MHGNCYTVGVQSTRQMRVWKLWEWILKPWNKIVFFPFRVWKIHKPFCITVKCNSLHTQGSVKESEERVHLYISRNEWIANQISMWQRQKARALRTHLNNIYRKAYNSCIWCTSKVPIRGSHHMVNTGRRAEWQRQERTWIRTGKQTSPRATLGGGFPIHRRGKAGK